MGSLSVADPGSNLALADARREAARMATAGCDRNKIFGYLIGRYPKHGEAMLAIAKEAATQQMQQPARAMQPTDPTAAATKTVTGRASISQPDKQINQDKQDKQVLQVSHVSAGGRQDQQPKQPVQARQPEQDQQPQQPRQTKQVMQALPPKGGIEAHARQLLGEWTEALSEAEEWRLPFELARVLRLTAETRPERFEAVIRQWCNAAGVDGEETYYSFLDVWDHVICPAGQDAFDVAARNATAKPLILKHDLGERYRLLASFAVYIDATADGEPIQLPRERLAAWLGVSARTVTSMVRLLERDGIVQCVDPSWSYEEGRAKTYKLTATDEQIGLPGAQR